MTTLCRLFWIHFYRVLPTSNPAHVIVGASLKCSTITKGYNGAECDVLFAWYRHMVQNSPCRMATKMPQPPKPTKRFSPAKRDFSLLWMSHCVACHSAGQILYPVTASCKGPTGNLGRFLTCRFCGNFPILSLFNICKAPKACWNWVTDRQKAK